MRLEFSLQWALVTLLLLRFAAVAVSDDLVPEDKCIVEVQAPADARIMLKGKPYGLQRRFEYGPLETDRLYREELLIELADGRRIEKSLLVSGGRRVLVPSVPQEAPEPVLQTGHSGGIHCAVLSNDMRYLLTGGSDRSAVLWNATTGKQLRKFSGHRSAVRTVAISPDGRHALTGCQEGTAYLWNLSSGRAVRSYDEMSSFVDTVAFSPDGRQFVIACISNGNDELALLRDFATGTVIHSFACRSPLIVGGGRGAGERQVLAGAVNDGVILWDTKTGDPLHVLPHSAPVHRITASSDGKSILTNSYIMDTKNRDTVIALWDVESGMKIQTFPGLTRYLRPDVLSADKEKVVSRCEDELVVWNAQTGAELNRISLPASSSEHEWLNNDGKFFIGRDKVALHTAVVSEFPPGKQRILFPGNTRNVTHVAISDNTQRILLGSSDHGDYYSVAPSRDRTGNTAILWDTRTGERSHVFHGDSLTYWKTALRSDGQQVFAGSYSGIEFWDVPTGKKQGKLAGSDMSTALAVSRSKTVRGSGHTVVVSDTATGKSLRVFAEHTDFIRHLSISADGQRTVSADYNTTLLWGTADGERLTTLTGPKDSSISSLTLSPDGLRVAVATNATIIVWDANTGKKLQTWLTNGGEVNGLAFNTDGRYLVTGSRDRVAQLWDATTGKPLRSFVGHVGAVTSVAMSSDLRFVVTGSFDGTARVWDISSGDELMSMVPIDGGKDWVVVTPQGLFDGSERGMEKMMFRIGEGLNVVPVTRFFQDFHREGLLARIWNGERPMPDVDMSGALPPTITLISPQQGGSTGSPSVTLQVEVKDNGSGIKGPFLWHNAARILVQPEVEQVDQTTSRYTFTASLLEGSNRLRITAATGDGAWESEPAEVTLTYNKSLPKPDLYVLAVGIDDYAQESLKLTYAAADATAVGAVFTERGSAFYENVHLTPLLNDHATKAAIRSSLRELAAKARAQDTLLVHFSGHGHTIGQRYYFVPCDFQFHSSRFEDDVEDQGLPGDQIFHEMGRTQARKRILVLDTCHSGAALQRSEVKQRDPFAFAGAIRRLSRSEGIFTIAACSASDRTSGINDLGHGVLTWSLLQGLQAGSSADAGSADSNGDGVVNISEWFGYAADAVPKLTHKYLGYEQDVHQQSEGVSFPVLPVNRD